MGRSKLLAVMLALITATFILSVSVAAPILLRPFYYGHIDALALEKRTGLSREQMVQAYDQVMDFCIGRTEQFSTGILPWSASGRAHFADVRGLFLIDLRVALVSGLMLLGWMLMGRKSPVLPHRFLGHGFALWGSVGLLAAIVMIGVFAMLDFERAFLLFHAVAFPGKYNWYFDPRTDGIIRILPVEFFRNCAVLILVLIALQCAGCIWMDLRRTKK